MADDKKRLNTLRLIRTENIGPVTFHRLLSRYGTAERALEALPTLSKRGGRTKPLVAFPADAAERELERIEKYGAHLIAFDDPLYPALLRQCDDAPPLITVLGDPQILSRPALGVVGARNASLAGRKMAESLSQKTGAGGYTIVSGLARGIDSAAHQAALDTGTIAVVAGGIDVIYPPENEKLYRAIAEKGAIVAESPFGTEPIARHFPKRNRIISGLSQGVLIVEAALKSGSLITARMALEQNREVFAVPGSPMDPRSGGANAMLKDGAHIVTTADDILHVLRALNLRPLADNKAAPWQPPLPTDTPDNTPEPDTALRHRVMESLSTAPVLVDDLIRSLDVPAAFVLSVLLELELAGRVERQTGNKVNLI